MKLTIIFKDEVEAHMKSNSGISRIRGRYTV